MIIDESTVKDGINETSMPLLSKLIDRHMQQKGRYRRLGDYYRGKHVILDRQRSSQGVANNRVVCNHAKYIVDMSSAYLVGNKVTYTADDGYDITPLINEYNTQDIANLDNDIVKSMGIFSRGYELVYADENSKPRSVMIDAENCFVVYSATAQKTPLFGVYYYKKYDVDGNCIGIVCYVYDSYAIYTFENVQDNWQSMTLTNKIPHYFGGVPLIEYENNRECQGDFEQLIPLIDAYNVLQSDRINDKEQFVDAFLFLSGIDLDSEQAKKLREERILMGYEDADARYLDKIMRENDIEILKNSLKEDIHRFSQVPDLSDEAFAGNLSGVAIKYKLMGFEQSTKNKERYFAKSLKKRLELYINFLSLTKSMEKIPVHKIDIAFTRNLPVNELEVSQMIQNLTGVVTNETLLTQLSFVNDPKEENEKLSKEREEKSVSRIREVEEMAAGGMWQ